MSISIFEYTDYRKFLDDFQIEQRKINYAFSHRYFAQKAGFTSTGLFSNILKGRRNLTPTLINGFSKAMKLSKKEKEYFGSLVQFNQASTLEEKNRYYERMLQISPLKVEIIDSNRHEFYSCWWFSAIRELLYYYRFKDDYSVLAQKLDPPIRVDQAKKAIKTLEKLCMIEKDADGYYRQTAKVITTGEDYVRSLQVENFQAASIDLARQSLDRHSKELRDISTLTLTLSEESFRKIKLEIAALQNRILKIAEADEAVNSVYQINFQVFPLSRRENDQE
ncbi:MAG: TIGR02147 family protein [Chitinispirillia bacterium]